MTGSTGEAAETRSRFGLRTRILGLGAGSLLLAIVIGTSASLVVATGRTCGCAQPPDLVVQNADTRPVTVAWQHEGLPLVANGEPGTGSLVVQACSAGTAVFSQGRVHVVVTSASEVRQFDLDIPKRYAADPFASLVVRAGGTIEDAAPQAPGEDPLPSCAPEPAASE